MNYRDYDGVPEWPDRYYSNYPKGRDLNQGIIWIWLFLLGFLSVIALSVYFKLMQE